MRRECRERFPRRELAIPTCITARAVTHVPWCMPGSLTSDFLWSSWWGKRSRHSRLMHNPQIFVSGRRPIEVTVNSISTKPKQNTIKRKTFCIFFSVYCTCTLLAIVIPNIYQVPKYSSITRTTNLAFDVYRHTRLSCVFYFKARPWYPCKNSLDL